MVQLNLDRKILCHHMRQAETSQLVSVCRINIIVQWIWQNPHKEGECVIIYFKAFRLACTLQYLLGVTI